MYLDRMWSIHRVMFQSEVRGSVDTIGDTVRLSHLNRLLEKGLAVC